MTCPICGAEFDLSELVRNWGGNERGQRCPKCDGRVQLSYPYGLAVGLLSVPIALRILALFGVRSLTGYVIGTIVLWIPVSLFLNTASVRIKPPYLRKCRPKSEPKPRPRTFFEWLYDRDAPQSLFNRRK